MGSATRMGSATVLLLFFRNATVLISFQHERIFATLVQRGSTTTANMDYTSISSRELEEELETLMHARSLHVDIF